jgi:general secretion pathway protein D
MKFGLVAALLCLGLISPIFFWSRPSPATAQDFPKNPEKTDQATNPKGQPEPARTNTPAPAAKAESALTNAPAPTNQAGAPASAEAQALPAKAESDKIAPTDEIPLSFQGANIDMVVQWLAKVTEKSVVKHPKVQCQLTIVSSKKLTPREAVNLVFRALAVEGFTTIESSKSILIVPEGQEPKTSPELMDASRAEIPEGRQRLLKLFPLKYIQAGELKEKVRGVLSDKAMIDADERANQIIVTDYTDNLRLLGELIKALDISSASESVIEIYSLKHLEAEELANLLNLVLNAQSAGPSPPARSPQPPAGGAQPPGSGPPPSSGPPQPPAGAAQASVLQVRLWPDKSANRLIVAAPKSKIPEVRRLIELLDTEKPQDVGVRVIALKNVNAEDLVKELAPLYQKMSGKSPKDTIEVTANNRSNSLIVLSSELNFKAIEKLVATLDTEEAQEKVVQTFPLRNADAEDLARQLQELNQEQDSFSRYYYYFSYPSSRQSKKLSVVADRRRNTVIVQAPPKSMESIAKMIKALDEPVSDNSLAPKIFTLKYVSATDIEDVLNELFLKKQPLRTYWFYDDYPPETTDRNVGRLYGKVRITSEPYSNSLIVTANSPENLAAVEEVLKKLDIPSPAGETTLRLGLQFAKALTVANSINILFAKAGSPPLRPSAQPGQPVEVRSPQQQTTSSQTGFGLEQEAKEDIYYPWLGGQTEGYRAYDSRSAARPVSDLVGRVRVVPDKRSNSLLITCNVHFFPQIMKLVNDLDAPTPQVLIEAKIVEVSSDFRDKLGIRWSPDGSRTFVGDDLDNSVMVKNSAAYRKVFAGSALADSLRTGVLDSKVNLDFLIQFLRKNTDATVLAEPQINIADNELGKLFVGSQVPFISGSMNTDVGGRNDTFQYRDVGIILEVTPHINNSEEVALKIRAESSNIRAGETLFGGAILDTRNFRTDLMVKSGQTVVLGGIIQREQQDVVRKVPLLGSIPGVGWAFKKKDKVSREVELMVFLSPKITKTPEQAKELLEEVEKKTPRIKKEINDVPPNKEEKEPAKSPDR